MRLHVFRISSSEDSTLGIMFEETEEKMQFLCFTMEDEARAVKVYGETRIPEGVYTISLRKHGGFHQRYSTPGHWAETIHEGMLQIMAVPNFEDVLIHTGNNDDHTAGCLLVGNSATENITDQGSIGSSRTCYKRVYKEILAQVTRGGIIRSDVSIEYHDFA